MPKNGKHSSSPQSSGKQNKQAKQQVQTTQQMNNAFVKPANGVAAAMPKKSHKKALIITLSSIVGVLVLAYLVGAFYFSSHFFPNTIFSSHDVSFESNEEFANEITDRVKDYELTIEGEGFSCTLDADQAQLQIDQNQVANDACSNQQYFAWPIELFKTHDVTNAIDANFDKEKAHALVSEEVAAFNETATPSENATITYNETVDLCVLTPEVYGTQIDADKLLPKVDESLSALNSLCEVTEDDLIKPTILSNNSRFVAALDKANKMIGGEIALTLNGSVSAGKITKQKIASWITVSEDIDAVLDEAAIRAWADQMGADFNTYQTTRTWTRADGKACSVSGGTFGWIVNTDSLATTVIDQINVYNFTTIDMPCNQTADVYNGAGKRDWGAYVDVDLSEQVVRYYDANDQLVHTCHCITGSPSGGHATPEGVYYLNSNNGASTLIGEKGADGKPEYETKVDYWMPFIGNSIGLHDASWQAWGSWNATRYSTGAGSHGCVNLSVDDASWFHDNLSVGVCIITHS